MLVTCTNCTKKFDKILSEIKKSKTGNHFCSSSCSASYNNSYRSRKDRRPNIICLNCGKESKSTHSNQKYCNVECQHEYQWKLKVKDIEAGKNLSSKVCKKYLLLKDPSCNLCGIANWQNQPIPLELDHIDGNGTNNLISNLRLLCPNCHSQTDNYKAKNASNPLGKEFRKKRYDKSLK